MRPEFDTQRKVEAYFAGKTDDDSIWIRDGLYALISDVLFVPDRNNPHEYHRASACSTTTSTRTERLGKGCLQPAV